MNSHSKFSVGPQFPKENSGTSSETQSNVTSVLLTVLVGASLFIYYARSVFFKFFFVPPQSYKKTILRQIGLGKPLVSTTKAGTYRRRLVFGSQKPSFYTNYGFKSTIPLLKDDIEAQNEFMSDMSACNVGDERRKLVFGFFHPYCNAGGGGERVLWQAVSATLNAYPKDIVAVYTGDVDASPRDILDNVVKRFDVPLDPKRVVFIYLKNRRFVDGSYWKRWTLLGQALGSILLSAEACYRLAPDVWIDTMGYPFAYPVISYMLKVPIVSYTHFPVIQSDMLTKLRIAPAASFAAKLKKIGKYVYWKLFLIVYSFVGYFIDVPLCNGTWTYRHLNKIWKVIDGESRNPHSVKMKILYPPCSSETLVDKSVGKRENIFFCLAQFRPEKRHKIIIEQYAVFVKNNGSNAAKLVLIGSIRGEQDREFVSSLKQLAKDLKVEVEFILDAPFNTVKQYMKKSKFGINAMWNEHFGIAVVETMAAGLIPISHKSAGPYLDIAIPWDIEKGEEAKGKNYRTGLFFEHESDPDGRNVETTLAQAMEEAVKIDEKEIEAMRSRAQDLVVKKFGNAAFEQRWDECMKKVRDTEMLMRDDKGKVEQLY